MLGGRERRSCGVDFASAGSEGAICVEFGAVAAQVESRSDGACAAGATSRPRSRSR